MTSEKLKAAKLLEARIKDLDILKLYLDPDVDHRDWWYDILRKFLPRTVFEKMLDSNYDVFVSKAYDAEFCADVCRCVDELLIKYKAELESL